MYSSAQQYRMLIKWNACTTDWFRRASEYTGFHKKLSGILLSKMEGAKTVCDLGCGAGMIDFYLAERLEQVTCVDRVPEVIQLLKDEIIEKSAGNMQAFCEDMNSLDGIWDTCIMLFVGTATENIGKYLSLCKDKLLIVDRGGCRESLQYGEKVRTYHSLLPMINDFLNSGIRCNMTDYTLEYGQPLTSLKEAYQYVSYYHKNPRNISISEYIKRNIVRTADIKYPYYLPYQKTFGIVEIRKQDNLHLL